MSNFSGEALVKSVLSGDTLVLVIPGLPGDRLFTLANLVSPKLARKDQPEEPFAFAAREHLRRMAVGKRVRVRVEYQSDARHDFGSLFVGERSLNVEMVRSGFVRVRAPSDKAVTEDLEHLLALHEQAKAEGKGMFTKDAQAQAAAVREVVTPTPEDLAKLLPNIRGSPKSVCVEAVLSGNLLRVLLKGSTKYYSFVLQFTGVQVPSAKEDESQTEEQRTLAKIGQDARAFTESQLLQRDVTVTFEGSERDMLLGTIVGGNNKTFSEELLGRGLAKCADWSISKTTFAPQLRAAERRAKESRARLWASYVAPASSVPSGAANEFQAKVIEVLGDILVVLDTSGRSPGEKRIALASIRTPKRDAPYSTECREMLRRALVGKTVRVQLDYSRRVQPIAGAAAGAADAGAAGAAAAAASSSAAAAGAGAKAETRLYYTVTNEAGDVGEQLVRAGLAEVIRHPSGEDRSRNYDALLAAEEDAKAKKRGLHAKGTPPTHRINDMTQKGTSAAATRKAVERAKEFLPFVERAGRINAVVDFCLSASRFKLLLPDHNALIVFALSGVRTPSFSRTSERDSEPFGAEALGFTREHVNQRDVQVMVETVDKGGSFLGNLYVDGKNLSELLVRAGLGSLYGPAVERSIHAAVLREAEDEARSAKRRIWSIARPEAEAAAAAAAKGGVGPRGLRASGDAALVPLRVTHVDTATTLYVHLLDPTKALDAAVAEASARLDEISAECEAAGAREGVLGSQLKQGARCLALFAADGRWYRAVVEKTLPGLRAAVRFTDYGNTDVIKTSDLRIMPSDLAGVPAQARKVCLAGVTPPPPDSEFYGTAVDTLQSMVLEVDGVRGRVEYVDRDDTLYLSLISADGSSVAVALLEEGLGRVDKDIITVVPLLHQELTAAEKFGRDSHANLWMYGDYEGDADDEY